MRQHEHLVTAESRRTGLWRLRAALAVACALVVLVPSLATAAPSLRLPFPAGETWWANGPHADTLNGQGPVLNNVDIGPGGGQNGAVLAAAAGRAVRKTCSGGFYVQVTHADGWMTQYKHLKTTEGAFPRRVGAGDRIGTTGAFTCASGSFSHLHFGLYRNEAPVAMSGVTLGGYTVTSNGPPYTGRWTRNADGAAVIDTGRGELSICCLRNDQATGPPPGPTLPATVNLGGNPYQVALGFGRAWLSDQRGHLRRLDARTGQPEGRTIRLAGGLPGEVTTGLGAVWVNDSANGGYWRVNPTTGAVRRFRGGSYYELSTGAGALWARDFDTGRIVRLNPTTGARLGVSVRVSDVAINQVRDLSFGLGSLWFIAQRRRGSYLGRIDPARPTRARVVTPLPVGACCLSVDLAFTPGSVWVLRGANSVVRVDARTGRVLARLSIPGAYRLVASGGSLWAIVLGDINVGRQGGVVKITAATNTVGPPQAIRDPETIAVGAGKVWVVSDDDRNLTLLAASAG